MTTRPDVPDRAVEAASRAIIQYALDPNEKRVKVPSRRMAALIIEAAAPHIIEQFIDGLTDQEIYDVTTYPSGEEGHVRTELKRLIPTPDKK